MCEYNPGRCASDVAGMSDDSTGGRRQLRAWPIQTGNAVLLYVTMKVNGRKRRVSLISHEHDI